TSQREVHGYYWAVLLTSGHIERLGGLRRIREDAPCFKVQELQGADGPSVVAVLTESPRDLVWIASPHGGRSLLPHFAWDTPVLGSGWGRPLRPSGSRSGSSKVRRCLGQSLRSWQPVHPPVCPFRGSNGKPLMRSAE